MTMFWSAPAERSGDGALQISEEMSMRYKTIFGIIALAAITAGTNLLFLTQTLKSWSEGGPAAGSFQPALIAVAILLGIGLLAGLVWLILALTAMARHTDDAGKAVGKPSGLNTVVSCALFLGICIVLYAFAEHWNKSWDLTQEGRRDLAPQTVQVLQNLDKDVSVVAFFINAIDDDLVVIAREKTERFLDQCQQYSDHLKVEFLDPQVDRARLEGLNIKRTPSTQGTVVISCGLHQKIIDLIGASPRLEERDFTNSLINVVRDSQPKVYFLTGHGERSIDDQDKKNGGSTFKDVLAAEGYVVDKVGIAITHPELPADCDMLVINGLGLTGPQSDLHPEEIRAIQMYLDHGGRLFVLLDPWRRVLTGQNQVEQLVPWLEKRYGIVSANNIALSPTNKWMVEFSGNTKLFADPPNSGFRGCYNASHRITQNTDQEMLFSAARTVGLAGKLPDKVVGSILLRTTPDYYAETDLATLTATGKASKGPDEVSGPLSMAVAVTAKTDALIGDTGQTKDARLVVVGDSDFAANGQLTTIRGNFNFVLNAVAWLSENEELIAIRASKKEEHPVILSARDEQIIAYIAVLGTIELVVGAGLFTYLLRRKYQ